MPPEERDNRWNTREVKHTLHLRFSWGVSDDATAFIMIISIVLIIAGLIFGVVHKNHTKDNILMEKGFVRCKIQGVGGMQWVSKEQARIYDKIYTRVRELTVADES